MYLAERRTEILTDRLIEIGHIAVSKSCRIVKRGDVAILVCPFVHHEYVEITAVDVKLVDSLRHSHINGGTRVGKDHNALFVQNV